MPSVHLKECFSDDKETPSRSGDGSLLGGMLVFNNESLKCTLWYDVRQTIECFASWDGGTYFVCVAASLSQICVSTHAHTRTHTRTRAFISFQLRGVEFSEKGIDLLQMLKCT